MNGKITFYFSEKGDELHKENSHTSKDRWMSEPVSTVYSDAKPRDFCHIQVFTKSELANSDRVHRTINTKRER